MNVPVFSSHESKAYPLIVGSLPINVYCHMENRNGNGACGDGGWTLVMKIDGNEVLPNYTNVMYCWNGGTIIDIITLYNYSGARAIREILVVTPAYVLPSARTDSRGGGEESQDNPSGGGVENAIFSWREIAWCFWATGVFLAGNRMTAVTFEKQVFLKA